MINGDKPTEKRINVGHKSLARSHPNSLANLVMQKAGEPSLNPKGRPKGVSFKETLGKNINELANEELLIALNLPLDKALTNREAMCFGLIQRAIRGDVAAFKEIVDRVDGKLLEKLEITQEDRLKKLKELE
jgi:hypothetical protein